MQWPSRERDSCGQCEETSPPLFTVNLIPVGLCWVRLLTWTSKWTSKIVSALKDAETGDPRVVVGECPNNPESISLTVLHRWGSWNSRGAETYNFSSISNLGRSRIWIKKRGGGERVQTPRVKLTFATHLGLYVDLAYRSFSYHICILRVGNIT